MENKRLYIYTYVDGVNDTTFPQQNVIMENKESNFFTEDEKIIITEDSDTFWANFNIHQLYIDEYTYTAQRMGNVTLSATLMSDRCLDSLWSGKEYVTFQGEKYFIRQTPTSSKDNTDERYKHELSFVSERTILDSVYFYDVVTDDTDTDRYASNSTNVVFYGDINEFVTRLNYSLGYSNVGYSIVVDDGVTSKELQISLNDVFLSSALQEIYNQYELAYYFVGKVIHVGFTSNAITTIFSYGADNNLISVTKTNANQKIINRCTGVGSSDNIPYYYPNESADREAIEASGKQWITPCSTLMPSIYRESNGAQRFYNATNDTYKNPETQEYYVFNNPYVEGNPLEHKITFEDIKPTIVGIKNSANELIGSISDIAFDTDDNDEMDEDGKYIHPYFFVKLHKFDGTYGFNLFTHSIEQSEMTISITSGTCGACEFIIGVDDETQKNLVQVDSNGNLLRDSDGNVRCGREGMPQESPQDRQNDTVNYECWIALKKDTSTFGVIMPNHDNNYKPNIGDTFVILYIDLPQSYVLSAEKKLDAQIIDYMANNNSEKFNFSINFSRIYLANNPTVASQINENARLIVEYDGTQYPLYISTYTYKVSNNEALPEITVELSDTITVNKSSLLNAIDSIKSDIMNSIGSIDFYKQGLKYFIRKDVDEYTTNTITFGNLQKFIKGLATKNFNSGALGTGFCMNVNADGDSYLEVDRALFRKSATFIELIIQSLKHVGGQVIISPASMHCINVETLTDGYKCYFKNSDNGTTISNEFVVNDLVRCQTFNLGDTSNRYYWRKVTSVGDDYIVLSKTDCDTDSDEPQVGDDIVLLGNTTDTARQGSIVLSSHGNNTPSITLYSGINSYSLSDKDYVSFGIDSTTNKAYLKTFGNAYIGDRDESQGNYISYKDGVMNINGVLTIGTSMKKQNGDVVNLNATIDELQTEVAEVILVANRAVSMANMAQDSVDNLQIGGANYANDTEKEKSITTTGAENQVLGDYTIELSKLNTGEIVTVSFDLDFDITNVGTDNGFLVQAYGNNTIWQYEILKKDITSDVIDAYENGKSTVHISYQSSLSANALTNTLAYLQLRIDNMTGTFTMRNLMVEEGDKETSWKPSLTDAKNDLQAVQDTANSALSQLGGLDYLKEALNEQTAVGGGLILTSSIQLGSKDDDDTWSVKSGINGIVQDGMPAIWTGGTISDNKCSIGFDGSGKLANGNISWDSDGVASFKNKSTATNDNRSLTIQGNTLQLTDKNGEMSSQIDGDIVANISELVGNDTSSVSVSLGSTQTVSTSASVTSSGIDDDTKTISSTISILDYDDCLVTEPNNYKIVIPPFNISCDVSATYSNVHGDGDFYSYANTHANIRITMSDGSIINSKTVSCSAIGYDKDMNENSASLTTDEIQFYTTKKYKIELVYRMVASAQRNVSTATSGTAEASCSISLSNSNDTTVDVSQISNLTRIFGNGMIVKQATNKYMCIANFGDDTPLINVKDTDSSNSVYGLELVEQYVATNGSEWYRKWNNGWLECGGKCEQTTTAGSGIYATFTFAYMNGFKNNNVCVNIAPYRTAFDSSEGKYFSTYVVNTNSSGKAISFTAHVLSENNSQYINGFYYYACGSWK